MEYGILRYTMNTAKDESTIIQELKKFGLNSISLNLAIEAQKLYIIKYIIENGVVPTIHTLNYAITIQNLNTIQYIIERGVVPNNKSLQLAIASEKFDIIKYIIERGVEINYIALKSAIETENIEIVNYIIKNMNIADVIKYIKSILLTAEMHKYENPQFFKDFIYLLKYYGVPWHDDMESNENGYIINQEMYEYDIKPDISEFLSDANLTRLTQSYLVEDKDINKIMEFSEHKNVFCIIS
jgi:hypothetical protein